MGNRLKKFLDQAFFPAHGPLNLAVLRASIFIYLVYFLDDNRGSYYRVASQSDLNFFHPVGVFRNLPHPLDPVLCDLMHQGALVFGALACIGFCFRFTGPLFGILLLLVLTYRQSWGFIYHTENVMVVHALGIGFAPAADRFSADAWISKKFRNRWIQILCGPGADPSGPSFKYGWPVQLILLTTGICYWVAGAAKLGRSGGMDWAFDAHLLGHIGNNALRYELLAGGARPVTFLIYSWPIWVIVGLSLSSLFLELVAPLAIVHRLVALGIALGLLSFHWGIYFIMGIPFHYQLYGIAFLPFIRWDLVLETLAPHWGRLKTILRRALPSQ